MILRGFEIEGFGIFRGMALTELPTGLTVLLGPNEAGKSTLLAFLRFMLFGFPRGQQQRYLPLQGGRHGGRLSFEDAEGIWTLERLQGQPPRLYAPDGRQLGEDALRQRLGGLDGEIFRNVFAFSLFELTNLETLSQDEVRDRLYSAGITGAGRSAASVLQQLRKGAEAYLRPRSREGVINKLSEELLAARRDLAQAMALAGRFEEIEASLGAAEHQAEELERQMAELAARQRHLARLESLYVPWNRLGRLEQEMAEIGEPKAISAELVDRIRAGQVESERAKAELERVQALAREQAERVAAAQKLLDGRLLEAAPAIRAIASETPLQRSRMQRLEQLGRDIAAQRALSAEAAAQIGVEELEDVPPVEQTSLRAVDAKLAGLRELGQARLQREAEAEGAARRLADAEAALAGAAAEAQGYADVPGVEDYHAKDAALARHRDAIERAARRRAGLLAPILTALAILVAGLAAAALRATDLMVLAPLGLLALLVLLFGPPGRDLRRARAEAAQSAGELGLATPLSADAAAQAIADLHAGLGRVTAAQAVRERVRTAQAEQGAALRQRAECQERLEAALAAESEARAGLASQLASLGVPSDVSPQHVPSYLSGVQALRAAQEKLGDLLGLQAAEDAEIAAWQVRAERILRELGGEPPLFRAALAEAIAALAAPLEAALGQETALRLMREEQLRGEAALAQALARHEEADAVLATAFGEAALADVAAFEAWRSEREAYERRQHDRDLALAAFRDQVGREEGLLTAELQDGSPELWLAQSADMARSLEEMKQQRDQLVRESQDLVRLRVEIAESADVPALAGRCAELEEELRRAAQAWRAQALAQRLLERTLDVYVQSRQPDVLRIASDAFRQITAGVYQEVRQRSDGQGLVAMAQGGGQKQPEELSRGTQEQLYLALRLGLAASYGERVAALPLVLDDIAVNFDPKRQAALLDVVARFAREPGRQALFFTCHPSLAQAARVAAPGLRVVDLAGQEARQQVAAASESTLGDRVVQLLGPGPLAHAELVRLTGASEPDVRQILRELAAAGRIAATGKGRGRRYGLS